MENKYIRKDIIFERKNRNYFTKEESLSFGSIETYKAKSEIELNLNGLVDSLTLQRNNEAYELILCQTLKGRLMAISLGSAVVGKNHTCRVTKKINLKQFEENHGSIWEYDKVLIVAVKEKDESEIVLEAHLEKEKKEGEKGEKVFGKDETGAVWNRIEGIYDLPPYLIPYSKQIQMYGHYLIGEKEESVFIAVPGRFIADEEVKFEKGQTTLWQPLKGGEELFESLETMDNKARMHIYGYWIGRLDEEGEKIVNT